MCINTIDKNDRYRYTVVFPIERNKTHCLSCFIYLIGKQNFNIKVLCLDRDFSYVDVFEFLRNRDIPRITPIVRRGKVIKQLIDNN